MFLLMAEQWSVPPWELERELSCVWADRWAALQEARARANKAAAKNHRPMNGKRRSAIASG